MRRGPGQGSPSAPRTGDRQEGFTLIELLVVILIIAILAAIAIPVFLRQRQRGYEATLQSALKNSTTAIESYAAHNNGRYGTATIPTLEAEEGLNIPTDVNLSLPAATLTNSSFCFEATHPGLAQTWHYGSSDGAPQPGGC